MSLSTPESEVLARAAASNRLGWFAIGAATVGFALTVAAAFSGGQLRWWQVALPALLIGNVSVASFGVLHRTPRLKTTYFLASLAIALAIVAASLRSLLKIG